MDQYLAAGIRGMSWLYEDWSETCWAALALVCGAFVATMLIMAIGMI
jgi:hypothetical protein